MSENFKLYKNIEAFIDNNCLYCKNEPFVITYLSEKENLGVLPIVTDGSNFIQCIMNLPKEKEDLLKDAKAGQGIKIKILDSSFEFILYKNTSSPSVIKCILLLIINDIEKVEAIPESDLKNADINSEYNLLEKLKKFIFNYIKKNKKSSNNELENILLGGVKNGIRFFNHDKNGINYEDENIKKIIEIIKTISSKLDIKPKNKKTEEIDEGKESYKKSKKDDNDISQVLDELNPDYKNELIYRYLDEMPEELVNLMKRYKNISFTQKMYNEYIDKNKNGNEIKDRKEILKDQYLEEDI